jgi:hypothetical protein
MVHNQNIRTDAIFERVLELIDRGVPVSKIPDVFAADERADALGAIAAVQALVAERGSITPPPELLSHIVAHVTDSDAASAVRSSRWARFTSTLTRVNPVVRVGVPVVAFAAILLVVISTRTGTVPPGALSVALDSGTLRSTEESATAIPVPAAMKNKQTLPVVAPQAAGTSADSAVNLIIDAALADADADQAIAASDAANAALITNDSGAVDAFGQFFDPNAL